MRYLVTGGAGFIGSHVSNRLIERGDEVVVFDDMSRGDKSRLRPEAIIRPFNIANYEALLAEAKDVDFILHFAASVGVKRCMDNLPATISNNVSATKTVAQTASILKKPLFFASTSEVYGMGTSTVFSEGDRLLFGDPEETRWIYSQTKVMGESLLHHFKRHSGLDFIIARFFNTVGPGQNTGYGAVMPTLVKQARGGDDLTVFGTGNQIRSFCYITDVVDAILALIDQRLFGEVYNIGNPQPTTISELANLIVRESGSSSQIKYIPYSEAYGDGFAEVPIRVPDISKINSHTGWSPKVGLPEIIERMING